MKDVMKRLSLTKENVLKMLQNEGFQEENEIFMALVRNDGTLFLVPRKRL